MRCGVIVRPVLSLTRNALLMSLLLATSTHASSDSPMTQSPATDGSAPIETQHAMSLYDTPALAEDFPHFSHVNPDAPKGGTIKHTAVGSSFDSTNPFIIRGTPAAGILQIYDTLMASNPNEPFSLYGLLAEGVRLDPDREWIEFDLRPEARFQDGEPVTAEDVVFSLNLLRDEGNPFYSSYYAGVEQAVALNDHLVRFTLSDSESRELPLIVAQFPVLPKHYWEQHDFTAPDTGSAPRIWPV